MNLYWWQWLLIYLLGAITQLKEMQQLYYSVERLEAIHDLGPLVEGAVFAFTCISTALLWPVAVLHDIREARRG